MGCADDQSTRFWQAGLDLFLALDFHVPIEDAGKWRDAAVEVTAAETRLLVQPSDGRKLTTRRESGQKNRPGMARHWDALGGRCHVLRGPSSPPPGRQDAQQGPIRWGVSVLKGFLCIKTKQKQASSSASDVLVGLFFVGGDAATPLSLGELLASQGIVLVEEASMRLFRVQKGFGVLGTPKSQRTPPVLIAERMTAVRACRGMPGRSSA